MYVSQDYRLVYLAPPRTGSTGMATRLAQAPFNAKITERDNAIHETLWHGSLNDYTTVITVRHPYLRAVSLWRFGCFQAICRPVDRLTRSWRRTYINGLPSLEGFLRFPELQTSLNTIWRCSWHQERIPKQIDHVIHLETFDADVEKVPKLRGTVFPRLNPGPPLRQPWHSFFTQNPTCIELVQQLWADDFDEFGYTRDLDACIAGQLFVAGSLC